MEKDDCKRSLNGIVACLCDTDNDKTRLIFDDVVSKSEDRNKEWDFHFFYTFTTLNRSDLESMNLPDEVYKEIGQNLILRLLARENRLKI